MQHVALVRGLDRQDVEIDEPGERVLVHRVDVGQIRDGVVQGRAVTSDRPVTLTEGLDFRLGFFCRLLLAKDIRREELRAVQDLDRLLVLQDARASRRKSF